MDDKIFPGSMAPDFCLMNQDGNRVCLHDFKGKWAVLYFYPRNNTSGCTHKAKDFTERIDDFLKMNTVVLGVSPR